MSRDTVLETDVFNNEPGHAAKHNAANSQLNFLTTVIGGLPEVSVKDPEYGAVGDGVTNDTAALTAAITAAAPAGKRVVIPPGVYLTDPLTITDDRVQLTGQGIVTLKPRGAHSGGLITVLGDDCVVSGVEIDGVLVVGNGLSQLGVKVGDGTGTTGKRATLRDVRITHTRQHGVYGAMAPDLTVDHCKFETCGTPADVTGAGIFTSSCANLTLTNNLFRDNWEHGAYILGGTQEGTTIVGNRALGNGIRKAAAGGTAGVGLSIRASGAVVADNISLGNDSGAFVLSAPIQGPTTAGADSIVTGNIFGKSTATAPGTASVDRELQVVGIDNTVISNNLVHSTEAGYCMRVGSSVGSKGCHISGNRLIQENPSTQGGLFVERENTAVVGNHVTGAGTAGGTGIQVKTNLTGITVVGNSVAEFNTGITLETGVAYDDVFVWNNHVFNCASALANGATGTNIYTSYFHATDGFRFDSGFRHLGTKVGFFGVTAVTRPTAPTAANAGTVNSGDATTDTVITNMRTRIGELESKLRSLGLIT